MPWHRQVQPDQRQGQRDGYEHFGRAHQHLRCDGYFGAGRL
ncbi:hypothetical protein OF001_U470002 [Pseudomonas sp. OF001]|nr:hypothetical protein OF001_U470002 [Pseudomonas sp. OF001]